VLTDLHTEGVAGSNPVPPTGSESRSAGRRLMVHPGAGVAHRAQAQHRCRDGGIRDRVSQLSLLEAGPGS
jgi:hypothetical protein